MKKETRKTLPGPGSYTLRPVFGYENHDITRKRYPAFSFGKPIQENGKKMPDPCYVKPGQTGFEKPNLRAPTTKGRSVKAVRVQTPGPGTYYPKKCPIMRGERAPAYTFGVRK
ncbi:outer dense fiber protein 3-like protein 2 [Cryptotermes secundus]|uniref:outer dense fiber protein 3-like protein 2 n=1 Tax=Cryptotermes secundus TaxID=105785 RepID=UPI000CD7CC9B|nr:outer dense fiber protein 3-like protein 2 [Cryptotermes secundus]